MFSANTQPPASSEMNEQISVDPSEEGHPTEPTVSGSSTDAMDDSSMAVDNLLPTQPPTGAEMFDEDEVMTSLCDE
jgi:hypothetical protein